MRTRTQLGPTVTSFSSPTSSSVPSQSPTSVLVSLHSLSLPTNHPVPSKHDPFPAVPAHMTPVESDPPPSPPLSNVVALVTKPYPPRRLSRVFRLPRFLRSSHTNRTLLPVTVGVLLLFLLVLLVCFVNLPSIATTIHQFVSRKLSPSPPHNLSFSVRRTARRLLHSYQRQLHVYPLLSRAVTAGIIFFFADFLAQVLNRSSNKPFPTIYSFPRNIRYTCYGLLLMGPLLYVWYDLMHRFGPPDDLTGSLLKAFFEALTLEPLCIVMYIFYDALVWKRTPAYVKFSLQNRVIPLWFSNSVFWFPANFSNYYVGTPDMRVIFSNLCSLFWNIYFSAKVNRWTAPKPTTPHAPTSASRTSAVKSSSNNSSANSRPLPV